MGSLKGDPLEGHPKYRIVRLLGRGGMGEVFEAEHLHLGTRMVVKLLHAELAQKPHQVDRMRIEAQALARLHHPNVVRVTDFDTTPGGRPFFVMDYLDGHSLRDELESRGGWLPVADAIEIVRQALAGLGSAHRLGLVHRDVKLDNLFLCELPRGAEPASDKLGGRMLKVLDFGVAKVLSADGSGPAPLAVPTATGIIVGTPRFLSPEQALGKPIDHRADLYAIGLVLYTLLVGRGPFDDCTTVTDMAKAHAFTEPPPPSRLSPQSLPGWLDAVVLRCLAKKAEDRYQTADELAKALEQALSPEGMDTTDQATTVDERERAAQPSASQGRSGERDSSATDAPRSPAAWPAHEPGTTTDGLDSAETRVRVHPSADGAAGAAPHTSAPPAQQGAHGTVLVETASDHAPTERIHKPFPPAPRPEERGAPALHHGLSAAPGPTGGPGDVQGPGQTVALGPDGAALAAAAWPGWPQAASAGPSLQPGPPSPRAPQTEPWGPSGFHAAAASAPSPAGLAKPDSWSGAAQASTPGQRGSAAVGVELGSSAPRPSWLVPVVLIVVAALAGAAIAATVVRLW